VEDCDISGSEKAGILITKGGNPIIRRCSIHDGKVSGLFVTDNGKGKVEDCDIFGNQNAGIAISKGGNLWVRQCRVNRNAYEGIRVYDDGAVTVEHSDLTDNAGGAWYVAPKGQKRSSGNKE
jgi:hypothetical protein